MWAEIEETCRRVARLSEPIFRANNWHYFSNPHTASEKEIYDMLIHLAHLSADSGSEASCGRFAVVVYSEKYIFESEDRISIHLELADDRVRWRDNT